jgi:hypothetical protein
MSKHPSKKSVLSWQPSACRVPHRSGVARTLGVILIAVILMGIAAYQFLMPDIGRPDEADRIVHPAGFSIIQPKGYEHTLTLESDARASRSSDAAISMFPTKSEGRPGLFQVARLKQMPGQAEREKMKLQPAQFAGQPAWEAVDVSSISHKKWTRTYVFEHDGHAYQIYLERPASEPVTGDTWTAYIESFKFEKPQIFQPLINTPTTQSN